MSDKSLSTPTDLKSEAITSISEHLNKLAASAFALYVQTKNFHWHLYGPQFRDLHLLFDEQADQIFEMIDPLAERVRKLGRSTLHSLGEISAQSKIKEDERVGIDSKAMLETLVASNLEFLKLLRAAHEASDKGGDAATTSILEVYLDETERRIWFLQMASN